MVAESKSEQSAGFIQAYKPSPYVETVWPTIEEVVSDTTFSITQFEVISQPVPPADPMFADFGSSETSSPPTGLATGELQSDQPDGNSPGDEVYEHLHDDAPQPEGGETLEPQDSEASEFVVQGVTEELEPSEGGDAPSAIDSRQQELEAALAAARQEGYACGVAETRQEVDALRAELQQSVGVLIEDLKVQAHELVQEHERKAVELALQVARRMLGSVVETQREYVISVIREAMRSVGSATIETIRISPRDFEFLVTQGAGEQLEEGGNTKHVFTSDETVKSGCVIVTSSGEIDFDLDAAWSRLHAKVAEGPKA
jgi:flagellar assembly protein FliH